MLDLIFKNIRFYIKSYSVYLLAIAFNVWIYCSFKMFLASGIGMGLTARASYKVLMDISSMTILMFTMFFIYYSTAFFIRKRSREFGIYMLLGINKLKISIILFFETLIIGFIGVAGGLVIATITKYPILSYIYSLIEKELVYEIIDFSIIFEVFINFFVIFALISILNIFLIRRVELIELFRRETKEQSPVKVSSIKVILSILILLVGYMFIFKAQESDTVMFLPIGLLFVLAGMFLTFSQIISGVCSYLRNKNFIVNNFVRRVNVNTLLYRIKQNWFLFTTVALLISGAISVTTIAFSLKDTVSTVAFREHPFTYIYVTDNQNIDHEVEKRLKNLALKKIVQESSLL